jgi:hypothetical protein
MIQTRLLALILLLAVQAGAQTSTPITFPYTATDSATTALSTQYEAGIIQRLFLGKNYRKTWSTKVKLPVFYLSQSGLQIEKLGGSKQTKSLYLKDKKGKEWVLRSVDKDVSPGVKKALQNTAVKNLMQDMISALYPYSQVIVSQLAQAAHIPAAHPQIYYVGEDPALGEYYALFATKVCALEERAPAPDDTPTEDTEKVLEKIKKSNDCLVAQKQVLAARLMDMLIGDWDRHAGNWIWGSFDSANIQYYYAIPRDRDNALFYSDGLVLKLFGHTIWPFYFGFTRKSTQLKKLNYKAWDFDKIFLNELDADTWQQAIQRLQQVMSDSVIEASVKILPASVYALDGKKLTSKLKSRRDGLLKNALQYYQYLSASVTINGTNEEEVFVVSGRGDKLLVSVFKKEKPDQKLYERLFDPAITHEIRLNGLKGDDRFITEKSARSKIRLKIYGNDGKDEYDIHGSIKTKVVDTSKETNVVLNNSSARFCFR